MNRYSNPRAEVRKAHGRMLLSVESVPYPDGVAQPPADEFVFADRDDGALCVVQRSHLTGAISVWQVELTMAARCWHNVRPTQFLELDKLFAELEEDS